MLTKLRTYVVINLPVGPRYIPLVVTSAAPRLKPNQRMMPMLVVAEYAEPRASFGSAISAAADGGLGGGGGGGGSCCGSDEVLARPPVAKLARKWQLARM